MANHWRFADLINRTASREFGGNVAYTLFGGASFSFDAIFDESHEFVSFDGEIEVITTAPGLDVDLTAFVAAAVAAGAPSSALPDRKDTLTVLGASWRVDNVMTDGRNGAVLKLIRLTAV